jgi:hypothetical protein
MQKFIYQQKNYPVLQNRVYDSRDEAFFCSTGNIDLVQDQHSGLIYNRAFNPKLISYDSYYDNEQSLSTRFQNHLDEVVAIIGSRLGKKGLVEIGCGKGFFLEMLLNQGFDVVGFDPTYTKSNPKVIKALFEPGVIEPANGLILRHVLEHIPKPVDFLRKLASSNNHRGSIYIEVPCLEWISERKSWQDIFYEHVNYFRASDFLKIFESVSEIGHLFNGQYIYVVADLNRIREPERSSDDSFVLPSDFTKTLTNSPIDQPCGIWGASSKGVVFSLLKSRLGETISFAIDINVAKQGKYLPCTAIEVLSPAQAFRTIEEGTTVYVMNPNYLQEIEFDNDNHFNLKALNGE